MRSCRIFRTIRAFSFQTHPERQVRSLIRPIALLWLTLMAATLAGAQQWGSIVIPARGLFDLEEGTVEAWVLFEFDPAAATDKPWDPRGGWFVFEVPVSPTDRGASFSISAGHKDLTRNKNVAYGTQMRVGWAIDGVEAPHPLLLDCSKFGRDQWHHFAVTWKEGRHVTVYADGKPIGEMRFPWSVVRGIPDTAQLRLQCPGYTVRNWLAIDDLRVSSVARTPEALGFHQSPLQPDAVTLLLDSFDQIETREGKVTTTPLVVANTASPRSYPVAGGRLIPGKSGQGFAFSPIPVP